jgi:hypothetical protein
MSGCQRLTAADVIEQQPSAGDRAQKKQHWPKDKRASETPRSNDLVSRAYEHVLFLEAMPSRYRGLASVFGMGLMAVAVLFFVLSRGVAKLFWAVVEKGELGSGWIIYDLVLLLLSMSMFVVAFIGALRTFRIDLLAPKEIPLVFNRRTRKVYRYVQDIPGFEQLAGPDGKFSLLGVGRYILSTFRPWPNMLLVEYDWDSLEAEYYEVTALAGNVIRTDRHLDLYVRESPGSDKVIGRFALVPTILTGEESGKDLWEHVRRFMQENGPALSPGDQPAPPPPKGFWQAANAPFNGPGWLIFLAGAIWTAKDVYWNFLAMFMKGVIPYELWEKAIQYPVPGFGEIIFKGFVIFFSYIAVGWVLFAVVASYLSKHVKLPEDLIREAGTPVDLRALAAAQEKMGSA